MAILNLKFWRNPALHAGGGIIAFVLGLASPAWSQTTVLEVIPLRYRAAQEMIPVIRPILGPEGTVSGFQGQLVVRTTPASMEEVKRILASIDIAPRQLLITVRQDAGADRSERSAEVSGRIGGERGRMTIPDSRDRRGGSVGSGEGDDRLRGRVLESTASASDRNMQSVRVVEGREAYLQVGQSVPVRERQVRRTIVDGQVAEQVIGGTRYRDVTTGFYVLPRISGDRITLDVSPQRETLSSQVRGGVNVQCVVTTVSGRLGEWIESGAVGQDASGHEAILLGHSAIASRDSRRVLVRVEEVH
jgi:hypothetical protein